ncbi:hypothetical protein NM688_g1571 [Phlebia brevispora]|uniref:Uncharacterized protein n=1 Tax=Phlebia brevispora TaxID=194682 RepID=A0ACC1TBA9_9APHY|nr:hypothetical protein NM688_g1571 [Phlebia brevispora]
MELCHSLSQKLWDPEGDLIVRSITRTAAFRIDSARLFEETNVGHPLIQHFVTVNESEGCRETELDGNDLEVFYFLMALYKFGELCNIEDGAPPFLAALDMAAKYGACCIAVPLLDKLCFWFPLDLEAWDNYWNSDECVWELAEDKTFRCVMSLDAARIFRSVGALALLPAALLRCCEQPDSHILEGYRSGDGILHSIDEDSKNIVRPAAHVLTGVAQTSMFPYVFQRAGACKSAECAATLAELHALWRRESRNDFVNPVKCIFEQDWAFVKSGLCEPCYEGLSSVYGIARKAVWKSLPHVFGLYGGVPPASEAVVSNRVLAALEDYNADTLRAER